MVKSVKMLTIIFSMIVSSSAMHAQGIYSEDFLNTIECRDFSCFENMMGQLNYSLMPEYSTMGSAETYQCNVANEDGGHDAINFAIYTSDSSSYDELIFATDRYFTYDALKTGLIVNAFVSYQTDKGENGATRTYYYSSLYPNISMITQTFDESPDGVLMQYYITLQINRGDLK